MVWKPEPTGAPIASSSVLSSTAIAERVTAGSGTATKLTALAWKVSPAIVKRTVPSTTT